MAGYHWLTPGIDILGAVPSTLITVNAPLPAGAQMKRFQIRHNVVNMALNANDSVRAINMVLSQQVWFTSGPMAGRIIYQSVRRIPLVSTAYYAAAIPVLDFYWSAGDNELGANQRSIYGKAGGVAQNLRYDSSVYSAPHTYGGTYQGEYNTQFAVLYYL